MATISVSISTRPNRRRDSTKLGSPYLTGALDVPAGALGVMEA
jgi:hypothetical protein